MTRRMSTHVSETFVRCKSQDTIVDPDAPEGQGCLLWDDHHTRLNVLCHIGAIPAAQLQVGADDDTARQEVGLND